MEALPDLAVGTTPVVQKAKELAIPGLYFTNLISARPLMGPLVLDLWPRSLMPLLDVSVWTKCVTF